MTGTTTPDPPKSRHDPDHVPAEGTGHTVRAAGHADDGSDHDAHGAATPLGPVDWAAWGAGVLGIVAAAVTTACLYLATAPR